MQNKMKRWIKLGFVFFFFFLAQDMENISEDDGWEFVNLGDQQSFGIKTAGLEEKATACQMLVSSVQSSPVYCSRGVPRHSGSYTLDIEVLLFFFVFFPGVLCQRAEGGFRGVHRAGGEADGPSPQVLLPR